MWCADLTGRPKHLDRLRSGQPVGQPKKNPLVDLSNQLVKSTTGSTSLLTWSDTIGPYFPFLKKKSTPTTQTYDMVSVQSTDGTGRDLTHRMGLTLGECLFHCQSEDPPNHVFREVIEVP